MSLAATDYSRLNAQAIEYAPSRFLALLQKYPADHLKKLQQMQELSLRVQILIVAALPSQADQLSVGNTGSKEQEKLDLLESRMDELEKALVSMKADHEQQQKINRENADKLEVLTVQIQRAHTSHAEKRSKVEELRKKTAEVSMEIGAQNTRNNDLKTELDNVRISCVIL